MKKTHARLVYVIIFIVLLSLLAPFKTIAEYENLNVENDPIDEIFINETNELEEENIHHPSEQVEEDFISPPAESPVSDEEKAEESFPDIPDPEQMDESVNEKELNDELVPEDADLIEADIENDIDDLDKPIEPDGTDLNETHENRDHALPVEQEPTEDVLPSQIEKDQGLSPQKGLAGITLLEDLQLTIEQSHYEGKERLTLSFIGYGELNLRVLESTYIIFQIPHEISRVISKNNLTASYDVPGLGLLGVTIRNKGNFSKKAITVNDNQISINSKSLL